MTSGDAMKDPTLTYYDEHAADLADTYEGIDFGSPVDRFASALKAGARVLEVGCGSGRDAARLVSMGFDVTAVDGSTGMLAQAASRHPEIRGRLVHHQLPAALPFSDEAFDGVMSWAVLMHLTQDELPLVFAEISRVAAPGGVVSYSVNTTRSGLDEEGRDARGRRFTPLPKEAWEQLHVRAGFVTRHAEETGDITGREGIRWVTFVGVKEGA